MKKFDAFTVNYWQTVLVYLFQIYEKINREIHIKENLNLPPNLLVVTKCSISRHVIFPVQLISKFQTL